jgi:hypothetical protein
MPMDSRKIEELLTKYWACETSLEEEKLLRQYFEGGNIPAQFKETATLFQYFAESKKKSIEELSFDGAKFAEPPLKKDGKVRSLIYNSMRIAAGIAVLMIAIWFVRSEVRETDSAGLVDTYDNPQVAFEETKKALMIISKGIGKAEEETKKINLFNEAQEEIQKSSQDEKL